MKTPYEIINGTVHVEVKRRNGDLYIVLFDADDLDRIEKEKRDITVLIDRNGFIYARVGNTLLHRFITECPSDLVVDHINHNGLDNRRVNLRVVDKKTNNLNRVVAPRMYGFNKSKRKWEVRVTINGDYYYIGQFDTKEEAKNEARELRIAIYGR